MGRLALAAVFLAALPAVAAEPGLSISVSLGGKAESRRLQVTFHNADNKDILIPLGMTVSGPHPTMLQVRVKMPDGQMPRVIYTGAGVVGGYAEPLTMGLRAGETYTLTLPLDRYYVLDKSEKLAALIERRCQLWMELEVSEDQCPNPAKLDSLRRKLPCWRGKVVSNVLQLPARRRRGPHRRAFLEFGDPERGVQDGAVERGVGARLHFPDVVGPGPRSPGLRRRGHRFRGPDGAARNVQVAGCYT